MLRNPFDISLRIHLLEESCKTKKDMERIQVYTLPDWSTEDDYENNWEWDDFYITILCRIESKSFTIYYSDDEYYFGLVQDYLKKPERISFGSLSEKDI